MIRTASRNHGHTLIEVLVAVVLLSIGMLGLSALQGRAAQVSMEGHQRTQALLLAQEMLERIRANKADAAAYAGTDYGGAPLVACSATQGVDRERCLWSAALAGAQEVVGGEPIGAVTRGRGCVTVDAVGNVAVAVAWEGRVPTLAAASDCGRGAITEPLRRVVMLRAAMPVLQR